MHYITVQHTKVEIMYLLESAWSYQTILRLKTQYAQGKENGQGSLLQNETYHNINEDNHKWILKIQVWYVSVKKAKQCD
jgi:hypothetical protein